jgi:caffeoyl-CoA O-methyltransferase
MDVINPALQKYSEDHTTSENDLLKKINRDTNAQVMMPRMLSGICRGEFFR